LNPGPYKNLNAIMSGLALSRTYLTSLGPEAFSLRPRLYGIDTMFMCAHANADGTTIACRSEITHSLSRDHPKPFIDQLNRNWQEAQGIAWTVFLYRRNWVILLPFYLLYFLVIRICMALIQSIKS